MELHTFSSLMADFLPQYEGCMAEADTAFVYFNPKVIAHKRLQPITAEEVQRAFGTKNVVVFTDSQSLAEAVRKEVVGKSHISGDAGVSPAETQPANIALLVMTSGTFDGIDIPAFAKALLGE